MLLFLTLTFVLSTPFYFRIYRLEPDADDRGSVERAVRQLMWVSGVVAFGLIVFNREDVSAINLGGVRYPWLLLVALLLPLLVEFILIFAASRFSLARVDSNIISIKEGWVHLNPGVRLVLGNEKQTAFKFVVNIMATVGVAAAFTLIFSFGEELGWRGYLQNRLIERFTLTWGMLIGGLLWALVYVPAVLKGYRFRDYPRLGAFVFMPLYLVSIGIVTGWLYALSGSLWVPAVFNASTRVSASVSEAALGDAGTSRRVRVVWLWLWAVLAGLALTLWYAGL